MPIQIMNLKCRDRYFAFFVFNLLNIYELGRPKVPVMLSYSVELLLNYTWKLPAESHFTSILSPPLIFHGNMLLYLINMCKSCLVYLIL